MKQKIKFKALTYQGEVINFTKVFDVPNFEVIPSKEFHGIALPETPIESQIIDWLDKQDKTSFMIENDLGIIIDYWIPKRKATKFSIVDYLKKANLSQQLIYDFMAVYKEIKPLLKGKSVQTQIEIVFSNLDVAYGAASNAYRSITAILQGETSEDKLLS